MSRDDEHPLRRAATVAGVTVLTGAGLALWSRWRTERIERQVPPLGRFVRASRGRRVHIVEAGANGPDLCLIHGLGGQARNFTHSLVERLAVDHRVVVPDRPGSGFSSRPDPGLAGPYADADLIAELIVDLGLKRPVLVGHSLGGAVSLALALRHPELVGGLALVAPLTHLVPAPPAIFRHMAIETRWLRKLLASTVVTPATLALREVALGQIFGPEPVVPDFDVAGGGLLSARPEAFFHASTDLLAVPEDLAEMEERYGEIAVPTAILYGRQDRILSARVHGEAMADRIPGIEIELVDGGHMLPLTQPGVTADFVRRVVARTRDAEVAL